MASVYVCMCGDDDDDVSVPDFNIAFAAILPHTHTLPPLEENVSH